MTDASTRPSGATHHGVAVGTGGDRSLEPHQARNRDQTEFEDALGDAIEAAYAQGIHDLAGLVEHLAIHGPPPPDGGVWTEEGFRQQIRELAGDAHD